MTEPNYITEYLADCVNTNTPVAFVKYGDGEFGAASFYGGCNCDRTPYTQKLGTNMLQSFFYLSSQKNVYCGLWFEPEKKSFWENLNPDGSINWANYHSVIIDANDIQNNIKEKFGVELSRFHINRVINDNNITLKITRIRHEPTKRFGKEVNITQKLQEFYEEIKNYKLEDIICIDETSISGLQKRNHCYSQLGKRCVIKTQSQDVFKRYTGIFAISYNGVLGWELYDKGGIDSDRLYEFLEKFITTKFKSKLIILDNASSHRNVKIKELVNKNNKLLYSVVYQHFTNSIENFFSMLKSRLQKLDGLTYQDLQNNIDKVIQDIPKQKYENIIKGTYNRTQKFIRKPSNRLKTLKNYK